MGGGSIIPAPMEPFKILVIVILFAIVISLGSALFPISIPQDAAVKDGLMVDRPAVLFQPDSPSAVAYQQLTEHLILVGAPA